MLDSDTWPRHLCGFNFSSSYKGFKSSPAMISVTSSLAINQCPQNCRTESYIPYNQPSSFLDKKTITQRN